MVTFLVGTSSAAVSERLCSHLVERIDDGNQVYVVNSLPGKDDTTAEKIEQGKEALAVSEEYFDSEQVETHQLIRGNDTATDLLRFACEKDVDEFVIGARKRNPTGKVIFGSTAQDIILQSDRPIWIIPRDRKIRPSQS